MEQAVGPVWVDCCRRRPAEAVGRAGAMANGSSRVPRRTGSPGQKRVLAEVGCKASRKGPIAEAGLRDPPEALPELQRLVEDIRGGPGTAGDREDPHAPGSAGQGAATRASLSVATASGLRHSSQHASGGQVPKAAGTSCARASQSRGLVEDCEGKPEGDCFERCTSALRSAFNVRRLDPRTGSVGDSAPRRRHSGRKKSV